MKKITYILLPIIMCALIFEIHSAFTPAEQLGDLAYDKSLREYCHCIYLYEGGDLVPYLVLKDGYSGNNDVLLLRKFVLDKPITMAACDNEADDYKDSKLDRYLNNEFMSLFSLKDKILLTEIILRIGPYDICDTYDRYVFLLSEKELTGDKYSYNEGEQLDYFFNSRQRIAYTKDGEAVRWWLRTQSPIYSSDSMCVHPKGTIFAGPRHQYAYYVRPAFCLPSDTPICKQEVNGEKVYVIDESK